MAYTLTNLQDDIRNYTEVDSNVLSDTLLDQFISACKIGEEPCRYRGQC